MREIKFRAWDKEEHEMFSDVSIIDDTWDMLNEFLKHKDELVFMQYTGLTDKNGVEIYEGDIILRRYYSPMFKQNLETKMAIEWNERDTSFGLWKEKIQYVEVIGNIYENPELLEESK